MGELPRLRRPRGQVRRDPQVHSVEPGRRSTPIEGTTDQYKWIVKDVGGFSNGINVLDVLLENSVSEAYLNDGVEILNGTKTPEQAMADIRGVAIEAKKKLGS